MVSWGASRDLVSAEIGQLMDQAVRRRVAPGDSVQVGTSHLDLEHLHGVGRSGIIGDAGTLEGSIDRLAEYAALFTPEGGHSSDAILRC